MIWNLIRTVFDHHNIFKEFDGDKRKSQSRFAIKIEDDHQNIKLIDNKDYYHQNILILIKLEFDIDVGRTNIVEILNSYEYKYLSLKVK